jgi:hypothetical protein
VSYHFPDAQAPTDEKTDDSKDSFNEKLEQVFLHFPKYYMNILLGDLKAKLVREDIFKNRHLGMRVYIRIIMIKVRPL